MQRELRVTLFLEWSMWQQEVVFQTIQSEKGWLNIFSTPDTVHEISLYRHFNVCISTRQQNKRKTRRQTTFSDTEDLQKTCDCNQVWGQFKWYQPPSDKSVDWLTTNNWCNAGKASQDWWPLYCHWSDWLINHQCNTILLAILIIHRSSPRIGSLAMFD